MATTETTPRVIDVQALIDRGGLTALVVLRFPTGLGLSQGS